MKISKQISLYLGTTIIVASMLPVIHIASAKQGSDDIVPTSSQTSGVKLRGDGTVDDTQSSTAAAAGVKLRGDGSVDDSQPSVQTTSQTQTTKLRGNGTVDDSQPGTAATGLKLRGDGSVDDSQPGTAATTGQKVRGDGSIDDSGTGSSQLNAAEHRSAVATFVQNLLSVADREPGSVGEQVRAVAKEQSASAERSAVATEKAEKRGSVRTFFFGPDYKNLGALRSEMVQTKNRIDQLNKLLASMNNDADKTEVQNQIQVLEQEQTKIENFIASKESKMSLFGWMFK